MILKIAIAAVLFSNSSFAAVQVGDTLVNIMTLRPHGGGEPMVGRQEATIVSISEKDDMIRYSQAFSFGSNDWKEQGEYVLSEERKVEKYANNVNHLCPTLLGTIETVTVPAGTFRACKVRTRVRGVNETWVWFAPNAGFMNIVKKRFTTQGGQMTFELQSFGSAQ
jgi:hypothetical protein